MSVVRSLGLMLLLVGCGSEGESSHVSRGGQGSGSGGVAAMSAGAPNGGRALEAQGGTATTTTGGTSLGGMSGTTGTGGTAGSAGGSISDGGASGQPAYCSATFIQAQHAALVDGWTPPSSTCVALAAGAAIGNYTDAAVTWQSTPSAECKSSEGFATEFDWLLLEAGITSSGRMTAQGQFRETRRCSVLFTLTAASCQCDVVAGPETYLGSYTSFSAELNSSVKDGQLSFSSPSVSFSSRFPSNESSSVSCKGALADRNGNDMCEGSGASATWLHQLGVGACHSTLNHVFFDVISPAWNSYLNAQKPIACPLE